MARRDLGVTPGLLDRHFGVAGQGNGDGLTKKARSALHRERLQRRKAHARAFDAIIGARPLDPPGRKLKP